RHQNLNPSNDPPVIYPGSIDRVDFSEEKEDKGFVLITIQSLEDAEKTSGKTPENEGEEGGNIDSSSNDSSFPPLRPFLTEWEFCPLPVRRFCTIQVDLSDSEDPHGKLLAAVKPDAIEDAVVRLIYRLQADQLGEINTAELYDALAIAHSYTVNADLVSQLARPRLPALTNAKPLDPLEALQFYLDSRNDLQDMATDLMAAAESLVGYRLPGESAQKQSQEKSDDLQKNGNDKKVDNSEDVGGDRLEPSPVIRPSVDGIPVEQLNLLG
ncbi:MAG: hypothetical protein AAF889_10590, partial [Cyanobacteria bacterium P01_D01_bin.73]